MDAAESSFTELVRSDLRRLRPDADARWPLMLLRCATLPDFLAAVLARCVQCLHRSGRTTAAGVMRTLTLTVTGLDISPGARIGRGVWLAHPVGVVIGNGVVLGEDVTLAGGVTLGSRNPGPQFGPEAFPTVGDRTVLGSHAVVLGDVRVGSDALVGAHAVVLDDVADRAVVAGSPATQVGTR